VSSFRPPRFVLVLSWLTTRAVVLYDTIATCVMSFWKLRLLSSALMPFFRLLNSPVQYPDVSTTIARSSRHGCAADGRKEATATSRKRAVELSHRVLGAIATELLLLLLPRRHQHTQIMCVCSYQTPVGEVIIVERSSTGVACLANSSRV